MSFTPFGQVIAMQGGSLLQKSGSVFSERLKVTKNLDIGSFSPDMLKGLLGSSGLGSIMQNPLSGIMGTVQQLTSQLSAAIPQLQGAGTATGSDATATATPAYPLTFTAATALQSAVTALGANVEGLSGTGATAPYGPIDLVLHATSVGNIGDVFPALSYAAAGAPLSLGSAAATLAAANTANAVITSLLSASPNYTDDSAAPLIDQCTTTLTAIIAGSTAAIGGLRDALTTIALAQAIGAATVSADAGAYGTTPASTALLATLQSIVQPAALATLEAQARAEYYVEPVTWTEAAPTINMGNVAVQQWVTAYSAQTGTPEAVEVI